MAGIFRIFGPKASFTIHNGGKFEVGEMNKSLRTKLLRLCMEDGKQKLPAIKDLDELLRSVGDQSYREDRKD